MCEISEDYPHTDKILDIIKSPVDLVKKSSPVAPLEDGEIPSVISLLLSPGPSSSPSVAMVDGHLAPRPSVEVNPTPPQDPFNPCGVKSSLGGTNILSFTSPHCPPSSSGILEEAAKSPLLTSNVNLSPPYSPSLDNED